MRDNVNKLVGNNESLNVISKKTNDLESLSRQFNKNSY